MLIETKERRREDGPYLFLLLQHPTDLLAIIVSESEINCAALLFTSIPDVDTGCGKRLRTVMPVGIPPGKPAIMAPVTGGKNWAGWWAEFNIATVVEHWTPSLRCTSEWNDGSNRPCTKLDDDFWVTWRDRKAKLQSSECWNRINYDVEYTKKRDSFSTSERMFGLTLKISKPLSVLKLEHPGLACFSCISRCETRCVRFCWWSCHENCNPHNWITFWNDQ